MDKAKITFIAEAGQGHEGSKKNILNYINRASKLKIDYLKFQIIYADELAFQDYKFYEFFKKLEIEEKDWIQLCAIAKKKNLNICFDVLGEKSLSVAENCNVNLIKLHATDIYNYPLQKKINSSKIKNLLLSISGCHFDEIKIAIKNLKKKKITLIFGYQNYPSYSNQLNFNKLDELKKKYNLPIGYADHSSSGLLETIYNCSSSINKGCKLIEKHFSFNKKIKIEDDESALDFLEYKKLIDTINICNKKNDDNHEFFSKEDLIYRRNISRSFYSSKNIKINEKITFDNISLKRGKSFNKFDIKKILNRRSLKNIKKNSLLKLKDFK